MTSEDALIQLSEHVEDIEVFAGRVFTGEGEFWWYRPSTKTFHPSGEQVPPLSGDQYLLSATPEFLGDYPSAQDLADSLVEVLVIQMERPVA